MAENVLNIGDVYWLAGLLEGEGCFHERNKGHNPIIALMMTDKDVVIRAARIMGAYKVTRNAKKTKGGKWVYRTTLYGRRSISWMMTLLPLMGERRKEKITDLLNVWKRSPKSTYPERKPYSRGAKIVWEKPTQEVSHR